VSTLPITWLSSNQSSCSISDDDNIIVITCYRVTSTCKLTFPMRGSAMSALKSESLAACAFRCSPMCSICLRQYPATHHIKPRHTYSLSLSLSLSHTHTHTHVHKSTHTVDLAASHWLTGVALSAGGSGLTSHELHTAVLQWCVHYERQQLLITKVVMVVMYLIF